MARARARAALRRCGAAAGRGCACDRYSTSGEARRQSARRRPGLPACVELRRLRSAAARTGSRRDIPARAGSHPGRRPSRYPAGLQGDHWDLAALRAAGWEVDLAAHVRRGGQVLGLCGGYQMLGTSISDPNGIEGEPSTVPGLGYLDIETRMLNEKALHEVHGESWEAGVPFKGYEMHVGESFGEHGSAVVAHRRAAARWRGQRRWPYLRLLRARAVRGRSHARPLAFAYRHRAFRARLRSNVDATLDALARHLERTLPATRSSTSRAHRPQRMTTDASKASAPAWIQPAIRKTRSARLISADSLGSAIPIQESSTISPS